MCSCICTYDISIGWCWSIPFWIFYIQNSYTITALKKIGELFKHLFQISHLGVFFFFILTSVYSTSSLYSVIPSVSFASLLHLPTHKAKWATYQFLKAFDKWSGSNPRGLGPISPTLLLYFRSVSPALQLSPQSLFKIIWRLWFLCSIYLKVNCSHITMPMC